MNVIFTIIFVVSCATLIFVSPDAVLSALTTGANKAIALSMSLTAIYALWSGALKVAEKSGVTKKIAKILRPLVRFLFGKTDDETEELIAINMSANLLGASGLATPPAIKATSNMTESGNADGAATLLVIASAGVQILPATVVSLRLAAGSASPADIILPTLISSLTAFVTGASLIKIFGNGRKKR